MNNSTILVIMMVLCLCAIFFISVKENCISGGNEVLNTMCNSSGELEILVGKYDGTHVWVQTGLDCMD